MKKKILCMGSLNIDLTMYMEKLPLPGETVVTDNFQTFPGGKGGNQAAAASILGGDVRYFTKLGDDAFSAELIASQKAAGVDTDYIVIEPGETAGIAMIQVDNNGQNSISFTPGANRLLTPEDVRANSHVFENCEILLITMEIPEETVYEAIKIAAGRGMEIILDPAPAPAEGIPETVARLVDYVKPNETEAAILAGMPVESMEEAKTALDCLRGKGFKTPIITLAEDGALTWIGHTCYEVKPMKADSIDGTAAGDIFLGAFAAALSDHKEIRYCLEFAKTASAISTERKGAQSSIPSYEEVLKRLQK